MKVLKSSQIIASLKICSNAIVFGKVRSEMSIAGIGHKATLTFTTHLVDQFGLPKEHGVPLILRCFLL